MKRWIIWILIFGVLVGLIWFFSRPEDFVNAKLQWMNPGAKALAEVAPVGTLIAVGTASILAYRTLRYRARVDDADQWWKRAQYGIDLLHGSSAQQASGSKIIETLLGPWLIYAGGETSAPKIRKLANTYGWRISEEEKLMLREILESALEGTPPDALTAEEIAELEAKAEVTKNVEGPLSGQQDPTSAKSDSSRCRCVSAELCEKYPLLCPTL